MATKHEQRQRFIQHYRDRTGESDIDMNKVAAMAKSMGWKMPVPKTAMELLAAEFSESARVQMRHDEVTKQPYRAQHCYSIDGDGKQQHLWIDIDGEAPRHKMLKAFGDKRKQMIGEGVQGRRDEQHWSRIHPDEEPIQQDFDLNEEIEWAMNAPAERKRRAS